MSSDGRNYGEANRLDEGETIIGFMMIDDSIRFDSIRFDSIRFISDRLAADAIMRDIESPNEGQHIIFYRSRSSPNPIVGFLANFWRKIRFLYQFCVHAFCRSFVEVLLINKKNASSF